jgi:hypothetical protein
MAATTDFTLERDAWGQLVMSCPDGRRIVGVEPIRAFPISGRDSVVSICDAEGHELVCLDSLEQLPPETRKTVEEDLASREFMPVVRKVVRVLAETDPSEWHIVTDRGPLTFLMEDSDDDVRRLGPNSFLLVDMHNIRYLIANVQQLDAASRRILDRYL